MLKKKHGVLSLQTISFKLRVFASKSVKNCRSYNSLHVYTPLVKLPKVMRQNINHN